VEQNATEVLKISRKNKRNTVYWRGQEMSKVEWKQNIGEETKYFYNFFTFHHLRHQIEQRSGISFSQVAKKIKKHAVLNTTLRSFRELHDSLSILGSYFPHIT